MATAIHKQFGGGGGGHQRLQSLSTPSSSSTSTTLAVPVSSAKNNTLVYYVLVCLLYLTHRLLSLIDHVHQHASNCYYRICSTFVTIDRVYAKSLRKLPKHVAFVLNEPGEGDDDDASLDVASLAKLITWCRAIAAESVVIYHISFDDHELTTRLKDSILQRVDITDGTMPMKIELVGPKCSHWALTRAANDLIGGRRITPVSIDQVGQHLAEHSGYTQPEVDLLVGLEPTAGRAFFAGFPLWQVRLAEMYFLPVSHRTVSVAHFRAILKKYARCQQRFGT